MPQFVYISSSYLRVKTCLVIPAPKRFQGLKYATVAPWRSGGNGANCDASRMSRKWSVTVTREPLRLILLNRVPFHPMTMTSQMLLRLAAKVRVPRASICKTYATTATSTRSAAKAPYKTPVAKASTTVGRANPNIVDELSITADEMEIPPEAYAAVPESVPSSSTLQHAASTVPAAASSSSSFNAPVEFADATAISGSPLDPSAPDWSKSYFGLSTQPFPKEAAEVLMQPVDPQDVEMKPGAYFSCIMTVIS